MREEEFSPQQVEQHEMLRGWNVRTVPQLLGYVKTNRRAAAQIPLVTDLGDPLLAHWRPGLGRVTAFTSDCKAKWAAGWITEAREQYAQFWAQVIRETARQPQGRLMDIRLKPDGRGNRITVDLLESPGEFKKDDDSGGGTQVTAGVYFVQANALSSTMKKVADLTLQPTGPGRYETNYLPREGDGVYLVRAQANAEVVSAGFVHRISGEAATGRVDRETLEAVCRRTGGRVLAADTSSLPGDLQGHAQFRELSPLLLKLLLILFLVDLLIRRWENVQGALEATGLLGSANKNS